MATVKTDSKDSGVENYTNNSNNSNNSNFGRYNLRDRPVIDSLYALSQVDDKWEASVVGGMGVAMYCWPDVIEDRYTKDLDAMTTKYLTRRSFGEGIGRELASFLWGLGYAPDVWKRGHRNYGVNVIDSEDKGRFFITLPKRSRKHFERHKELIRREYDNAEDIAIPTMENETVKVIKPEDLILPKLHRMRPKDAIDIKALLATTKDSKGKERKLDWKYLRESALFWCGGVPELAEDDVNKLKKIRQSL